MEMQTKTVSVRVRDKYAPLLRQMAFEVNQILLSGFLSPQPLASILG